MVSNESSYALFLGTGTSVGVPMIACHCPVCVSDDEKDKRLRSSVFVSVEGAQILIDAGPDFRTQMLKYDISSIDALLVTHYHKDHIGGIDDIRAFNISQNMPIPVYATEETQAGIKREIPYAFAYPFPENAPKLDLKTICKDEIFYVKNIPIIPIEVWHGNLKIMGFRIGSFTYITDCSGIDDDQKEKIKGSARFAINGIRWEKHRSHFSIGEALSLSAELGIPHTYITHISHQLGKHRDVSAQLSGGAHLAYDGLRIDLSS